MMVWLVSGVGLLCAGACRHAPAATPPAARHSVQVLVQAGPAINPGDDGQPWPTAVTLYQLRDDPAAHELEPIDGLTVLTQGDAAFGDLLIDRRDYTAFPDTRARIVLPLAPETTHLVALARFRDPLGDAAVLRYAVPATPDACFYLGLERSELDGGDFPPPGFDPAAFATTCPPPAALTPPAPDTGRKPSLPAHNLTPAVPPTRPPVPSTSQPVPSTSQPVPSTSPRSRP